MNAVYDLVRRSTGAVVCSFPDGGRHIVTTENGLLSVRPLLVEETVFTPASMIQFLMRCGYQVIPPTA
ncbi:hypothetical protein S046_15295 [Salmonella enterica subsp. enterica serovar Give]|uniref:hypothetical protein n=1 Tax=Salmonella enterica TaxID=28901 RepID=UPI000B48F07C|nr:hypothetical protein [Salmonella enterica]EBR3871218.1 hypothetical protein [Salmonella enterica subsp. enterica]ECE0872387.1 hypothetical protein [Salmonella enterica subsp. enterica serovar Abaetetuba]EDZ8425431.1 hypothetical protein [Salmonella enterica subsp. enterica serovar Give]ASA50336.1 hypothetical protein GX95_03995 [Salmonella enterica subsp. enterica serovar Minnesota]EAW8860710.1 hypothetical protein [Salmonella enterica]